MVSRPEVLVGDYCKTLAFFRLSNICLALEKNEKRPKQSNILKQGSK